jgi:hypothetical protein
MIDEPKRPRDELADRIVEGDADVATLIATVLVKEVLPALDHIRAEVAAGRYRLMYADMALAQIGTIYEHLQDLAPLKRQGQLARERLHWQERLEKVTCQLEELAMSSKLWPEAEAKQ